MTTGVQTPGRGDATGGRVTSRGSRITAFVLLGVFVALMWVVEAIDWSIRNSVGGRGLDDDGVHPWTVDGLFGILAQPFLHSGWGHLAGNSVALLVLGSVIALSGVGPLVRVTLASWLLSGVVCWLIGGLGTMHIGASGIVFGYLFYVVLRGLFTRRPLHLVAGLAVASYYGLGALAGLSPLQHGVSWQGHLGGAVAGTASAAALRGRRKGPQPVAAGQVRWSGGPPR